MSETLAERIERHEGYRQFVYSDSLGHPTVGIGRALDTRGISRSEALYLLANDIERCTTEVRSALLWTVSLDETRFGVLVEMAFQLGTQGLMAFHATLGALARGDWEGAATQMLASKWAQQTPARAQELAQIIRSGSVETGV